MGKTVEVPEYEVHEAAEIDPDRTGLLVVDMQNDFVDPEGALFVEEARESVRACQHVLASRATTACSSASRRTRTSRTTRSSRSGASTS